MVKQQYNVIGLMSGTSLDGLDVCYVEFTHQNYKWNYKIKAAETFRYSPKVKESLESAHQLNALDFILLEKQYGRFIGKIINAFVKTYSCAPDFIASHGHTIFHQPDKMLTYQIGDGASIAAECCLPVICDFRSLDVALGGQGAPLVPIGDHLLFNKYDYCLNIGGFANISFEDNGERTAYDVCPANIVLNYYSEKLGKTYDNEGAIAAHGIINRQLVERLNQLEFYTGKQPKSLGREWVEELFLPIVEQFDIAINDKLASVCEHIAQQIACTAKNSKLFITGGGAYNTHLINRIKYHSNCKIIIPDELTIDFKEALIFAFLGVLYITDQPNCLSSVTGAKFNSIGGSMFKVY